MAVNPSIPELEEVLAQRTRPSLYRTLATELVQCDAIDALVEVFTATQNPAVRWHALWVMDMINNHHPQRLFHLRPQFIALAMAPDTPDGSRRLALRILLHMGGMTGSEPDLRLFDYALSHCFSLALAPASQSLCVALACKMVCAEPQLAHELRQTLGMGQVAMLSKATQAAVRKANVLLRKFEG